MSDRTPAPTRAPDRTPVVVVLGDLVYDLLVAMREPLCVGSDTRAEMRWRPGGAGANVAAHLAGQLAGSRLTGSRLAQSGRGVESHFIGRVGDDPFGRALVEALRAEGVVPHVAVDHTLPTGTIVVLVNADGERTMITDRGANLGLSPRDLPRDLFARGRHLHLSGYAFFEEGTRAAALTGLDLARQAGMTISVDPASASLLRTVGAAQFLHWTTDLDVCFPSLEEGAVLTGRDDPAGILAGLRAHYRHVALTLGADGAIVGARTGETVAQPASAVQVVDSTGAGDAFCAAFLSAWLNGCGPGEAARQGVTCAGAVVGRLGAR